MIQLDVNSDSLPLQPLLPPAKPQGPGDTRETSDETECPRECRLPSSRHAVVDFCDIVCPVSMDLDRHHLATVKGLARGGMGLLSALPGEGGCQRSGDPRLIAQWALLAGSLCLLAPRLSSLCFYRERQRVWKPSEEKSPLMVTECQQCGLFAF